MVHSELFSVSILLLHVFIYFSSSTVDTFASARFIFISSALALPVSRGRHAKLGDNFCHESDVMLLKTPF